MRVTEYEMIIYETIHIPTRWSNRILSKVQKSFWSCTPVNSYSKFTLHINLHIVLMFYSRHDLRFKNKANLLTTPKICTEQGFIVENNLLLHYITIKTEATRIYR